jgi:hypothetical protein
MLTLAGQRTAHRPLGFAYGFPGGFAFGLTLRMSSALSEPGGLGLGTLGLHEQRAREMTTDAGFSRFRRLEIEHPVNAFYEVRP